MPDGSLPLAEMRDAVQKLGDYVERIVAGNKQTVTTTAARKGDDNKASNKRKSK